MSKNNFHDAKILIVDDDKVSIRLLTKILADEGYANVESTRKPSKVLDLYNKMKPDLVLLDLHMPHMEGFKVMEQLSGIQEDDYLPILVISQERNRVIQFSALEAGAKDFLVKPFNSIEVLLRIRNFLEMRLLHNEARDQNKILERKVQERTDQLYHSQIEIIQRLSRVIEYRDSTTGDHTMRLEKYMYHLALALGIDPEMSEMISTTGSLHDVGKVGIPDIILLKPGPLTPQERKVIETHTDIGAKLLTGSDSKFLQMAEQIALTHHERWDGKGYPKKLKGEDIPLAGRICGLCDVFDALLSKRPYKEAWPMDKALEEIKKESGSHFDPHVVGGLFQALPQIRRIYDKYGDH